MCTFHHIHRIPCQMLGGKLMRDYESSNTQGKSSIPCRGLWGVGWVECTNSCSLSVPNHWVFSTQTPQSPGKSCVPWIKDPLDSELLASLSAQVLIFSRMIPSVLWRSSMVTLISCEVHTIYTSLPQSQWCVCLWQHATAYLIAALAIVWGVSKVWFMITNLRQLSGHSKYA